MCNVQYYHLYIFTPSGHGSALFWKLRLHNFAVNSQSWSSPSISKGGKASTYCGRARFIQQCFITVLSIQVPDEGRNATGEALSFVSLDDSIEPQSEDSGIGISKTSTRNSMANNTMEDVGLLSPTSSSIDEIGKKAQDLIERINERRAMDQHVMDSFEEKLIKKVREMCQQVKEQMFVFYEQHSQGMEASISELSEVLERSSQLSMELQGASQTLAAINKGLQHSTEQ
ncbi:uncharacterized protein LOC127451854 isoform X1 [Myxocyprinus asiaticus]|uniref:uncharacterized protein LOC127451854 isoform X1 n=1 Tax=Myxocyprinus asiaticus TaxID=70543 RepID=UPI0022215D89|nr:uncharacterized protein LOC127451854 isoform X1 [Myxocyprinus asiaticus]